MNSIHTLAGAGLGGSFSERLEIATATMAGRLADLLDRALPEAAGDGSRGFLRAMAMSGDRVAAWHPGGARAPLDRLAAAYDLSPLELELMILAGMPEEHEGYAGLLRTLHPAGEPRPTAGLAAQLLVDDGDGRRELRECLEVGRAATAGILRLQGEGPFFERSLTLAEALWSALHGIDRWPAELSVTRQEALAAGLDDWLEGPLTAPARAALAAGAPVTLLVTADNDEIAVQRAAALVASTGETPVRVEMADAPTPARERLIAIHATCRGVVPLMRIPPSHGPGAIPAPSFGDHPGPVAICGRSGTIAVTGSRPVIEVRAERLSPTARRRLWSALAPELAADAAVLAARYTVEPEVAAEATADARAVARLEERPIRIADIAHGVRTRTGLAISSGVRLIRPAAGWEHLVLPERRLAQLREALSRLTHQARVLDEWGFLPGRPGARGVRMLFAGGSGTGKTFTAEVLAGELGVDLLLVDISRVVSKWIGETEKNLAEVFDAAEHAQAVLLFDEADALFGKRTEVSDAHDRYANLETAFLLTRLERFEGLAILSTNLRQNIDTAFTRRLEFVLDFEEPGPAERAELWRKHLPAGAPVAADVDLREIASLYGVVGGFIRNAAVAAGFLAAAEGSPVTRAHIVRAIRREYEKSGRAFPGYPAGMAAL